MYKLFNTDTLYLPKTVIFYFKFLLFDLEVAHLLSVIVSFIMSVCPCLFPHANEVPSGQIK